MFSLLALLTSLVPRTRPGESELRILVPDPATREPPRALPLAPRLPRAPVNLDLPVEVVDDVVLHDSRRHKDIPLRLTFPRGAAHCFPLIVFSHGAWSSKEDYPLLIQSWAARGYVCIQPSHADALAPGERPDQQALRSWASRPRDVSHILDSIDLVETLVPALSGCIDPERVGVGGHSFGAGTAQLLAGARLRGRPRGAQFRDRRVRAVLLLSPQGSGQLHGDTAWAQLRLPMLIITGTRDYGRGGGHAWRSEPFHRAPPGAKYLIVVEGGQHDMGGIGRSATTFPYAHDERQAQVVQTATLAFWDAHLKHDTSRQDFLRGSALEQALGEGVRVERK